MSLVPHRLVIVRGAGDLATGCIVRLVRSGFCVVALEQPGPSSVRRTVSLSEAMYEGSACVEGVHAVRCQKLPGEWETSRAVQLLEDPGMTAIRRLSPAVLVDAIVAKRNTGISMDMAPVTVALGPGFTAGVDVHAVIETNRGHNLGRVILEGTAEADTGTPGLIAGYGPERVLRAPVGGEVKALREIGDRVKAGEAVVSVEDQPVRAAIDGIVRGIIRPGFMAHPGLKIADIDPRCKKEHCFTISDKARAIGGGVLEAILMLGS